MSVFIAKKFSPCKSFSGLGLRCLIVGVMSLGQAVPATAIPNHRGSTPRQTRDAARVEQFATEVYANRRERLAEIVGAGILVVPGGQSDGIRTFRQADALNYLTGVEIPLSILVIVPAAGRILLFVPDRYQGVTMQASMLPLETQREAAWNRNQRMVPGPELRSLTGIEEIYRVDEFFDVAGPLLATTDRVLVAYDETELYQPPPLSPARTHSRQFADSLAAAYPSAAVENLNAYINPMRLVKDAAEIAALRKAAQITAEGINDLLTELRPGMTERMAAGMLIANWMLRGAHRVPFDPFIKSGAGAVGLYSIAYDDYDAFGGLIRDGDLVFIDDGAEYGYYAADVCRTVPANGRFTAPQRRYYDIVLEALDAAIAQVRPGVTMEEVVKAAAEVFDRQGLAANEDMVGRELDDVWGLMPSPTFYVRQGHGLTPGVRDIGHHIGLAAMDSHDYSSPLAPGWVFTLEPKIYAPDLGLAVMVEDMILVTEDGAENLSGNAVRTAVEIEAMMASGGR